MEMKDEEQIWVAAYSLAMAMIVLGATIKGTGHSEPGAVDAMDENAKLVADRVKQTIIERAAQVDGQPRKGARS